MPHTLSEARKRHWDANLSLVTTLATIAGLLIGVYEFTKGEKDKVALEYTSLSEQNRIDFNRKLWLERLDAYRAVAQAAGKISADIGNQKQFEHDLQDFEAAYWGRMILVEDPAVAVAMQKFRDASRDYKDHYINADALTRASAELGQALQKSINNDPVANDLKNRSSKGSSNHD